MDLNPFFFALFLCYRSENLRGKLEDFCHFFTVNFDLNLSPNQFFLMVSINCRNKYADTL